MAKAANEQQRTQMDGAIAQTDAQLAAADLQLKSRDLDIKEMTIARDPMPQGFA
jgi:hypothetical protein